MTETQAQFEPEDHLQHLVNYFEYFSNSRNRERELIRSRWLYWVSREEMLEVLTSLLEDDDLTPRVRQQLQEMANVAFASIENDDSFWDHYGDAPDDATLDALAEEVDTEALVSMLWRHAPEEVPYFDCATLIGFEQTPDWLVHASNEDGIESDGFQRGVDDIDKLCLTTYLEDFWKRDPGYNFAFTLRDYDRYGTERGRQKYGKYLYLVRAPYVRTWHDADNEPQAIFWGPDAHEIWRIYGSEGDYTADISDLDLEDEDGDRVEEITAGSLEELADMLDNLLETGPATRQGD